MTPEVELSGDALYLAVCRGRDRQFASVLAMMIGLAAKTHPDELRSAIAEIFDMKGYIEQADRIALTFANLLKETTEANQRLKRIEERLDKADAAVDSLRDIFDKLQRQVPKSPVKAATPPVNGVTQRPLAQSGPEVRRP